MCLDEALSAFCRVFKLADDTEPVQLIEPLATLPFGNVVDSGPQFRVSLPIVLVEDRLRDRAGLFE